MPIHFRCPHCDKLLAIGTAKGGTQIHCPLCDQLVTVPPRTEVQLPTTTVLPPDLAQTWWTDAPPVVPPKAEPPPEAPPPADAWWLTSQAASVPPETAISTTPTPSVPPPLPQSFAAAPVEPPPDLLVFEPPAIAPALETIPRQAPERSLTPVLLVLVIGVLIVALLALSMVFVFRRGSEPVPVPPATKTEDADKTDEKAAPPKDDAADKLASASQPRAEHTEEELCHEAAAFPEITLEKDDEQAKESEDILSDMTPPWLTRRRDLSGLPIRTAKERFLEPMTAEQLQAGALALRAHLFAASQGGEKRPDAQRLHKALTAHGEQGKKWLRPEAVPALQQLLMAEDAEIRQVLVEQLARIDGPRAGAMLARNALFDLNPKVRQSARDALSKRPREEHQQVLLDGLRYPWPAVVDHAAAALIALKLRETVPALLSLLDQPSPAAPNQKVGQEGSFVREVVRINHPRNCLLCHAPSRKESDKPRGFVPSPDQPLPPPFTREYYANRRPGQFVRADVTYLQQDFSVTLPVEKPGKWPALQRFDFLVRERAASDGELQSARQAEGKSPSAYQQAIFFALRELTDADPGATVEDWKRWAKQSGR